MLKDKHEEQMTELLNKLESIEQRNKDCESTVEEVHKLQKEKGAELEQVVEMFQQKIKLREQYFQKKTKETIDKETEKTDELK